MIGISCGMALSVSMITIYAGFDRTIDLTLNVIDSSKVAVTFTHAASEETIFNLRRLEGVTFVEPVRHVPVLLRNGLTTHRGVVSGLSPNARLNRALDRDLADIPLENGGIVYNAARIAYAKRSRDLAGLRVIGFTKGKAAFVLLGELAIATLIALPIGSVLGYYLSFGIAAGFSSELYQIPAIFDPASYGQAMMVVLVASVVSGWLVKRDLDRSDLVEALKTRE